jgi:hypothetical protein
MELKMMSVVTRCQKQADIYERTFKSWPLYASGSNMIDWFSWFLECNYLQDKQLKSHPPKNAESEILREHIKKEREAAKAGKRPYYLKKCEFLNPNTSFLSSLSVYLLIKWLLSVPQPDGDQRDHACLSVFVQLVISEIDSSVATSLQAMKLLALYLTGDKVSALDWTMSPLIWL